MVAEAVVVFLRVGVPPLAGDGRGGEPCAMGRLVETEREEGLTPRTANSFASVGGTSSRVKYPITSAAGLQFR